MANGCPPLNYDIDPVKFRGWKISEATKHINIVYVQGRNVNFEGI